MIKPCRSGDELLADIRQAREQTDALHLWWLGQSGFLLQWQGRHLLIDPYLSDSLTRKYARTDKPHVRMTALAIEPQQLDFIDVVTSSHNHTDHLDADTLVPLLARNPRLELILPKANIAFAVQRLQVPLERLRGLDDGQSCTVSGMVIHAVPAAHETVERDELGRCRYLGYVFELGPWRVYHSGDTIRYDAMDERLRAWPLDVALLPINGRAPERRVAGNLSAEEAAQLACDAAVRLVIPCHYQMFTFNTADPAAFVRACQHLHQSYRVLQCGEHWSSRELAAGG